MRHSSTLKQLEWQFCLPGLTIHSKVFLLKTLFLPVKTAENIHETPPCARLLKYKRGCNKIITSMDHYAFLLKHWYRTYFSFLALVSDIKLFLTFLKLERIWKKKQDKHTINKLLITTIFVSRMNRFLQGTGPLFWASCPTGIFFNYTWSFPCKQNCC